MSGKPQLAAHCVPQVGARIARETSSSPWCVNKSYMSFDSLRRELLAAERRGPLKGEEAVFKIFKTGDVFETTTV